MIGSALSTGVHDWAALPSSEWAVPVHHQHRFCSGNITAVDLVLLADRRFPFFNSDLGMVNEDVTESASGRQVAKYRHVTRCGHQ